MNLLGYLTEVSLCSAIFYALYFWVLSRFTFFALNRIYLLFSLVVSLIIPAIDIQVMEAQPTITMVHKALRFEETNPVIDLSPVNTSVPINTEIFIADFNWTKLFTLFYYCITGVLIFRLLITVLTFAKTIRGFDIELTGSVKLLINHPKLQNGSFLNYIFIIDYGLNKDEVNQVFSHELIHVKRYHSADRIFVRLLQVMLWFNPVIYWFAKSIEQNHEFEVDQEIAMLKDKHIYANLLLQLSISESNFYHSFSKEPLKKRIAMLFNQPTPNMKKLMYVLTVPVVLISCLAFARFEKVNVDNAEVDKNGLYALPLDSQQYKQKVVMTRKQRTLREESLRAKRDLITNPEFQKKMDFLKKIQNGMITAKIQGFYTNKRTGKKEGYLANYQNEVIVVSSGKRDDAHFDSLFSPGEQITFTIALAGLENNTLIKLVPEYIIDGTSKMLVMAKIPEKAYPFLYEVNKVRFADGKIARLDKFSNGKLRSADVETGEGTVLSVNFKPGDNPGLSTLNINDEVRFRFVHEQKVAEKNYVISDWVSISKDIKNYGIKNPDFFYKFYEKI
ncbi:M56 family metallopeptidase [Pedobacter duraquae]|uniref:BlaR1 peptidase M56 n=1 Tax=Pedobacter duraquae TaxID=425511 RepID=A0A4R6IDD4_9SPHI|nr:M56 family metallopeptidase [Pedobacter duraquae]TDO19607.1 BlaR1 peptidase M56 [Pedobacter duraquae]